MRLNPSSLATPSRSKGRLTPYPAARGFKDAVVAPTLRESRTKSRRTLAKGAAKNLRSRKVTIAGHKDITTVGAIADKAFAKLPKKTGGAQ